MTNEEDARLEQIPYDVIFDSITDAILVIDPYDLTIISANKAAADQVKMAVEEIVGKHCHTVFHNSTLPLEQTEEVCLVKDVVKSGHSVTTEHTHYDVEGNARRIETTAYPVKDSNGKIVQVINVYRDITERKRMEDELRYSGKVYRTFLESSMDSVFVLDSEKYVYVNRRAAELLGYDDPSEIVGEDAFKHVAPEYREMIRERSIARQRGEVQPSLYETKLVTKDGTEVDVEIHVTAIEFGGRPVSLAFNRDITERKRMEEEVRSLARFPSENTNPVGRISGDGIILYANAAFESLLDEWEAEIGSPAPEEWLQHVSQVLSSGVREEFEVAHGDRVYSFDLAPVVDAGYVNLYGRDITERKRIEDELKGSEERYRSLVERSPNSISVTVGNEVVFVNKKRIELTGQTESELLGTSSLDNVIPDDRERILKIIQARESGEEVQDSIEFRMMTKDGRVIRVIDYTSNLIWQGSDAVIHILQDVTQRKALEDELRQSEERLRNVFAASPDAITISDLNGIVIDCNQATLDLHGILSRDEVIGRSSFEFIAKKDHERAMENLRKTFAEGVVKNLEYTLLKADGHEFIGELSASVVRDTDGHPISFIGITKDISERKRFELIREALYEHLGIILSARTIEEIAELTLNTVEQVLGFQMGAFRIVEEDPLNVINMRGTDTDHFSLPLEGKGVTVRVVATGESHLITDVTQDEEYVALGEEEAETISELAVPVKIGEQVVAVLNVESRTSTFTTDDQMLLETLALQVASAIQILNSIEAIKESEERYKTVVESSMDGICVISDASFVYANQKMAEIFGLDDPEKLVGQSMIDFIVPEEKERIAELCANLGEGGSTAAIYDTKFVRADDQIRETEISSRLIEFLGQPAHLCIWRDVTDRNVLRRQLEWEKIRAERSQELERLRNNFLSSVSHELRTPLNSIIGFSDLFLEGYIGELTEEQTEHVSLIRQGGETLLRFINDLLDLQKLEARAVELHLSSENVSEIVNAMIVEMSPQSFKKGLPILTDVPPELVAKLDVEQVKQVLRNLLSNAIKFTDEGEILLRVEEKESHIIFSVADTGIGIPEDKVSGLFERYAEVDPAIRAKYGGTGLGLRISKEIVDLNGGEIWAESVLGEGSTFYFTLPIGGVSG